MSDFGCILLSKTGKNFSKKLNYRWQQANQVMKKVCLFWGGGGGGGGRGEPLSKGKKRTSTRPVSSCLANRKTINFPTPISLSQRENTPFRNDKLKEKLLRNTLQFQERKYVNQRRRNCASRTLNCRFIHPTS